MTSRVGQILLLLGLIGLWEVVCRFGSVPALVVPRPSEVAVVLWQETASGRLLRHAAVTTAEMLLGLALATALGLGVGTLLAECPSVRRFAQPYLIASQVIPKLALAPLFQIWFGFGMKSIVIITALVCFFPLLENTVTGLDRAAAGQRELFRLLRASRWQTLFRLKFPAGLPVILAGLRVAVVLSLVGAIVGEFIMGREGLGASVVAAQGMMDTPLMFALFVVITVLGSAVYQGALVLERSLLVGKDMSLQLLGAIFSRVPARSCSGVRPVGRNCARSPWLAGANRSARSPTCSRSPIRASSGRGASLSTICRARAARRRSRTC